MVSGLWYTNDLNFGSLSWIWRCKKQPCLLSPDLELWRMLEILDWGLASWSSFVYDWWSFIHLNSEFWLSILILKVQRTSMSFKSWYGALVGAGGSWLGFGNWVFIWIWSLVFFTPLIQILFLYVDFKGAKNIYVLKVLIWSFGRCWRFLAGVWHHDLHWCMVSGLWYTHDTNFDSLS